MNSPISSCTGIADDYTCENGQQTGGSSWNFSGGVTTEEAALRYYQNCYAELAAMRGPKRPASDDQVSGPATKKRVVRPEAVVPAASTAEEIAPSSPKAGPGWETLSRPHHPAVKAVLAEAGPFRRISVEEKLRLELGDAKRRTLEAKTEAGKWQFETACAQTELNKERKAAQLGWKLLWNQKARITQLEAENKSLNNQNTQFRSGTAYNNLRQQYEQSFANGINLQLMKDAARAETVRVKQQATKEIAKRDAEIAELKKRLAAKNESIKKAFTE
jgi:hypothetical protein